jgi:hypothetical protein
MPVTPSVVNELTLLIRKILGLYLGLEAGFVIDFNGFLQAFRANILSTLLPPFSREIIIYSRFSFHIAV